MRRTGGRETWHRLLEWDKAQSESERLAARLLATQGYEGIDPSHPLGGSDAGKDIVCLRGGQRCLVAVYFPRGQQRIGQIKEKLDSDLSKLRVLDHPYIVFFTNQELRLAERQKLENSAAPQSLDIYHLERIASCLDSPSGYGLRLEFLSIEMTKEEQISFINDRDQVLFQLRDAVTLLSQSKRQKGIKTVQIEQPDLFNIMSSVLGTRLVECKSCQEVFRAMRPPLNFYSRDALETVTCPACGKVQAFK
jgi:hypothetical protein